MGFVVGDDGVEIVLATGGSAWLLDHVGDLLVEDTTPYSVLGIRWTDGLLLRIIIKLVRYALGLTLILHWHGVVVQMVRILSGVVGVLVGSLWLRSTACRYQALCLKLTILSGLFEVRGQVLGLWSYTEASSSRIRLRLHLAFLHTK